MAAPPSQRINAVTCVSASEIRANDCVSLPVPAVVGTAMISGGSVTTQLFNAVGGPDESAIQVDPTYAREILSSTFGMGLDGVLNARMDRLQGIVNGIDTGVWDPATDRLIPAPYSAKTLPKRSACSTSR